MQKLLIIGNGRLCQELKSVLGNDYEIHIHSVSKPVEKFENFYDFDLAINTVPKPVTDVKMFKQGARVYELASPPYGFIGDTSWLDYIICPKLPGKFFPREATELVMDFKVKHYDFFSKDEEFVRANNNLTARAVEKILKGATPDGRVKPTLALCVTGSSCCYLKLLPALRELVKDYNLLPVLSGNANVTNRFMDIEQFRKELTAVCGHNIVTTIAGAEVLASNKEIVASLVLPATGNTIAKLANAVTDTPVTMAVKALLRNAKPCIIGISTNDALSGNAANIGLLLNRKGYYFIPYKQDDVVNKPFSMVCDFAKAADTIENALRGKQIQPIIDM